MYWRLKNWVQERWIRCRYTSKPVGIYYDKFTGEYVNPKYLELTTFSQEMLLCDMVRDGLVFVYRVGGHETHDHTFVEVMTSAYRHGSKFSIEGYESMYSEQERRLLLKLVEKGTEDFSNR